MKTKTIIVYYLILVLIGLALSGFPQGITNNGGYITGSSSNYIKFSGGSNMILKSTTPDRTIFGNMSVDFTGSGSYKLILKDDSYLTVDGNLTLSDTLLLEASSSDMASLITNGTVSGSYAKVEQYLIQDQWHIISAPVASAKSGVYAGIYMLKWNEPDSTWTWVTSLTEPLTVTKGFFVWSSSGISSPTDVTFSGLINTGDQTPTLTYNNGLNKGDGWNLLGNPYPSALEWNSSWTKTNVDATVYVYDGSQYKTWNYNLGGYGTKTDGSLPPTQGFWVHANAASPSLTIPNSERIHSSQAFYKGAEANGNLFTFSLSGNGYEDDMIAGFLIGANDGFDSEWDAEKKYGVEDAPQFYSVNKNLDYTVNIMPELLKSKKVPVGMRIGSSGYYDFELKNPESVKGIQIYLEDKLNPANKIIDLTKNPLVKVFMNEGTFEDRFILHFVRFNISPNPFKSNNNEDMESLVQIYSNRSDVYINYLSGKPAVAVVYDLLGREILSADLICDNLNKLNVNSERGYYIVQVFNDEFSRTEKVYLQ